MARRKHKIHDPAEAARKAAERDKYTRKTPEAWGANKDAMTLPNNSTVAYQDGDRSKVTRIRRYDGLALLESRDAITSAQGAAARRLEDLIARRYRTEVLPTTGDRVDGGGPPIPISDDSLDALNTLHHLQARTGAMSFRLLVALLEPNVKDGQPVNNWRAVTRQVTGEHFEHGQTACVRIACENLREAFVWWDNRVRKAA